RHQQDQPFDPALARPDLQNRARTGGELRARILPAERAEVAARLLAALLARALRAVALADDSGRPALADGGARCLAARTRGAEAHQAAPLDEARDRGAEHGGMGEAARTQGAAAGEAVNVDSGAPARLG